MDAITYSTTAIPTVAEVIRVFDDSGLRRPTDDPARIEEMISRADLIVTAWEDDALVGIARSLTDFAFCCYLSDLAVTRAAQRRGIGKRLIELTQECIGPRTNLVLLSAPDAMEYYPKVGFTAAPHAFLVPRKQ